MATKQSGAHGDQDKIPLDPAEWNFRGLPEDEKWPCMAYELLRESASVREEATNSFGFFHGKVKEARGRIPDFVPLPDTEEFRKNYTGSRILTLACMRQCGFPELPWQGIKDQRVRAAIGECLRLLSTLPKQFEHNATLSAAVNVVSLVRDDKLEEKLLKDGVERTASLCWVEPPLLRKEMHVLFIEPSADDATILEGVRACLPSLRKKVLGWPSIEKKKGGRKYDPDDFDAISRALGLMRLAYHLPAKLAWKTLYSRSVPASVNIVIRRARDTCVTAMHARFELPQEEKPIHYRRTDK